MRDRSSYMKGSREVTGSLWMKGFVDQVSVEL